MTQPRCRRNRNQRRSRHRLYRSGNHQPGAGGAPAVAARAGSNKAKKSEPAAATRARPVNNAGWKDWLRSPIAFRRVRCHRRGKSASQKRSVSLEGHHSSDAQKEVVATPKALKKALEHEKSRNWRRSWRQKPLSATRGRHGEPTFATKTGRTGGAKCLERESDNAVCLHLRSSQRHLNNPVHSKNWLKR